MKIYHFVVDTSYKKLEVNPLHMANFCNNAHTIICVQTYINKTIYIVDLKQILTEYWLCNI